MLLHVHVSRNAALDARKSRHGNLTVDVGDEWLASLSDAELNLLKHYGTEKNPVGQGTYSSADRYYHDQRIELAEPTPAAVLGWLTATVKAVDAYRVKKEQTEREQHAERIERWLQRAHEALDGGPEGVIRSVYTSSYHLNDWPSVYGLEESEVREKWPELSAKLDELYVTAAQIAEQRRAEKAAEVEAAKQAKAEAKARHDCERIEWIAEHGSKHLKDLVEHGFPYAETYRTERREMELGDECENWVNFNDICGSVKDIRDPSWEVVKAWKDMRKLYAGKGWSTFGPEDIKLQWLGDGPHGDSEDTDDYSCPLCGDEIRQRPVLTLEYMDELYIHEIE